MVSGFYDITSKTLGKGHYGIVKLGRHCLTGEPVAIKVIEKSRLNHDSLIQLGSEIKILFRLSEYEHPNILKLYQTIDTKYKLYLVTEYCGPHAGDLHEYLQRKNGRNGLAPREAKIFFIQICSAISYCHSMSIVHRDLKPENILVADFKHVQFTSINLCQQYPLLKLIDFGFANQWSPDEKMRTSCGTLAYSAPELLLGEPYDGTKVDIWGLGLMLYILVYGGNPFMQINDNETLTKILDCSFSTPLKSNVDGNVVELLRSLIKRNPDSRLPVDAILKHKWFADVDKPLELTHKYPMDLVQSSRYPSKQLPKLAPVVSPTLPSISESGPLRNLNASLDDNNIIVVPDSTGISDENEVFHPGHNRSRSLSITRIHPHQQTPLVQTRSSINLERLSNSSSTTTSPVTNLTPRGSIYRPTSPDVGGVIAMSDEEREIHDRVIQDMFKLGKIIGTKSSIEASLKNARFSHRVFNPDSIERSGLQLSSSKKKAPSGLVRLLDPMRSRVKTNISHELEQSITQHDKLSSDDYIYATYQLTRDKIIRYENERLSRDREVTSSQGSDVISEEVEAHSAENLLMAYSLPLARKCSLVSEESVCSNEFPDSGNST